jgi:Ca2+-binding EF-hand superfamily protein
MVLRFHPNRYIVSPDRLHADIRTGYKRFFNKELSDKETDKLFQRINTSETGFIDYTEFVIAAMQKSKILDEEKLRAAFSSFDRGDKGYISENDLRLALSEVVALPVSDYEGVKSDDIIDEMMKQVDKEGDGQISYHNFVDMMTRSSNTDSPSPQETPIKNEPSSTEEEKRGDSLHDLTMTDANGSAPTNTTGESGILYDWATASWIGHDSDDWTGDDKKGGSFQCNVAPITEDEESSDDEGGDNSGSFQFGMG